MAMLMVGCDEGENVRFLGTPFPTPDGVISGEEAYLSALSEALVYASEVPAYRSLPVLSTRGEASSGSMAEPAASEVIWIVMLEFGEPVHIMLPSHRCPPDVDPCPPRFNAREVRVNALTGQSTGGASLYPDSPRRFVADIPVTEEDVRTAREME